MIALAYGLATVVLFPAYAQLPVIADVYQPSRADGLTRAFLTPASFNVALLIALAFASGQGLAHPPARPAFVAPAAALLCGFAAIDVLITFFLQGKGWVNHSYPGMVLALLA